MFASAMQHNAFGGHRSMSGVYHRVGVQTGVDGASPHRLVEMLFDGLMDAITQGRGAMRAGNVELKTRALSRAVRIVDEGLKASLNLEAGGKLAQDLCDLYAYVTLRLTQANLRDDEAALDECQRLLEPVREAWTSIGNANAGA